MFPKSLRPFSRLCKRDAAPSDTIAKHQLSISQCSLTGSPCLSFHHIFLLLSPLAILFINPPPHPPYLASLSFPLFFNLFVQPLSLSVSLSQLLLTPPLLSTSFPFFCPCTSLLCLPFWLFLYPSLSVVDRQAPSKQCQPAGFSLNCGVQSVDWCPQNRCLMFNGVSEGSHIRGDSLGGNGLLFPPQGQSGGEWWCAKDFLARWSTWQCPYLSTVRSRTPATGRGVGEGV